MKWILLLLLAMSCSTYHLPKTVDEIPDLPIEDVPTEVVVLDPIEVKRETKIEIVSLTGFTKDQEARFKKIVANTEVIINSPEYKEAVLNYTYLGKKQFIDTTDTNLQVWKKIHSQDWKLEYRLERLSFFSKTIGYTYPNVTWIVLNSRKWFDLSDADICANIVHEYGGHKLGRYNHADKWNKDRDHSAPYALGYVAKKIYEQKFP